MPRPYAILRAGFPYDRTIGESRRFRIPRDLAIHKDGRIFVFTNGSSYGKGFYGPISVTNLEDEPLGSFGWQSLRSPVPPAAFMWGTQVVLDNEQNTLIFVDAAAAKVSFFNVDGPYLGRWGEEGSAPGKLKKPSSIAVDGDDNVWVVDSGNHRVQRFTRDGRLLMSFGAFGTAPGQFNMPWGIHIDKEYQEVYVADWRNDRVQVFDFTGKFLWTFGSSGSGNGQFNRPSGIAVDSDGDIYVADFGNNRVQLFDRTGRYVQKFHGDATMSRSVRKRLLQNAAAKQHRMRDDAVEYVEQEKLFTHPRSVRVDHRGYMYVPDTEHWRVQIYRKESYLLDETQVLPPFKVPTLNAN
ncbi:MAG: 6-bladed beta-propeller [SAR202 cluster bacterium]|nr:6-bladed beta-propeller [SAR202 cluster bacterium]